MDIALKTDPDAEDIEAIERGLIASNEMAAGRNRGFKPFALHLVDPRQGLPVGGLSGWTLFDWVYIDLFHVPASLQGHRHGRALMQRAEDFARQCGCVGIWLDTFSFQARPFYEKLGFTVFGEIDEHPRGGKRFFMQKRIET